MAEKWKSMWIGQLQKMDKYANEMALRTGHVNVNMVLSYQQSDPPRPLPESVVWYSTPRLPYLVRSLREMKRLGRQ